MIAAHFDVHHDESVKINMLIGFNFLYLFMHLLHVAGCLLVI